MTGVALDPDKAPTPLSRDLIALTKPRIISLLLVTTVAPRYAAGSPSLLLVLLVTIGGYLMAGGANAVNMYLDRDIDDVMARTRLRPVVYIHKPDDEAYDPAGQGEQEVDEKAPAGKYWSNGTSPCHMSTHERARFNVEQGS